MTRAAAQVHGLVFTVFHHALFSTSYIYIYSPSHFYIVLILTSIPSFHYLLFYIYLLPILLTSLNFGSCLSHFLQLVFNNSKTNS